MIIEYVSIVNGDVKFVLHLIIVLFVRVDFICMKDGVILHVHKIRNLILILLLPHIDVDIVLKNGITAYSVQPQNVKDAKAYIISIEILLLTLAHVLIHVLTVITHPQQVRDNVYYVLLLA